MSYTFLDASASSVTAQSSVVNGYHYPVVFTSALGATPVSLSGTFSVVAIQEGTWRPSAIGYVLRNDAVASSLGADLTYRPMASDSAGRVLTKPYAPVESDVQGVASTVNTISTSLLAAAGAGLRNYLTDILVTNTGSVATLVEFQDGDNSVIGRTIAPATSGSNIHLARPMKTNGFNQQIHFKAGTAVSILGVSGYGYKAP